MKYSMEKSSLSYTVFHKKLDKYKEEWRKDKTLFQSLALKSNLNKMISKFIIPSKEHPVSSAHIPKVPPKLAILSVIVVLTSSLFISTSELLYCSLTIMVLFMKCLAIFEYDEWILSSFQLYSVDHKASLSKLWENVLLMSSRYLQKAYDPEHQFSSSNGLKSG